MLNHLSARGGLPMIGGGAPVVPSDVATTTDLTPLNLHLFILPDQQPEKIGELYVPPSGKQACSGTVIASASALAAPGDRVAYSGFWPFDFEGKTHVAVLEKHLVGVKKLLAVVGHQLGESGECVCGAKAGDAASRVACPLAEPAAAGISSAENEGMPPAKASPDSTASA